MPKLKSPLSEKHFAALCLIGMTASFAYYLFMTLFFYDRLSKAEVIARTNMADRPLLGAFTVVVMCIAAFLVFVMKLPAKMKALFFVWWLWGLIIIFQFAFSFLTSTASLAIGAIAQVIVIALY